jgi:mannose-6-phosphate isomerase
VAKLHRDNSGKETSEELAYAELWMGTHPSGPTILAARDKIPLKQWLGAHPETLGEVLQNRWGAELPYLFKVKSETLKTDDLLTAQPR